MNNKKGLGSPLSGQKLLYKVTKQIPIRVYSTDTMQRELHREKLKMTKETNCFSLVHHDMPLTFMGRVYHIYI